MSLFFSFLSDLIILFLLYYKRLIKMLLNPLSPLFFLKISSLKATILFLLILLVKTNLLRLKGGLIGGLVALILISGIILSSSVALGSIAYAISLKRKQSNDNNPEVTDELEPINI